MWHGSSLDLCDYGAGNGRRDGAKVDAAWHVPMKRCHRAVYCNCGMGVGWCCRVGEWGTGSAGDKAGIWTLILTWLSSCGLLRAGTGLEMIAWN